MPCLLCWGTSSAPAFAVARHMSSSSLLRQRVTLPQPNDFLMCMLARCMQVRLGKMSDLLDALMEQFPMPPPALFAANDIDK